jgi:hypothetical protein
MNTGTLKNRLERLEVRRKKNGQDAAEIVIKTCWGNEDVHVAPDVIVIKTKWGGTKLARNDEEEYE